jgi:uncharacterized protein (DUF488 family)
MKKGTEMTKFVKTEFQGTEYVSYNGKFVARFKRGHKASFISFLIKNFTVDEYFSRLNSGEAPLEVLQSKGYLLPHIKKMLKESGYEVTVAGYRTMIEDKVASRTVSV